MMTTWCLVSCWFLLGIVGAARSLKILFHGMAKPVSPVSQSLFAARAACFALSRHINLMPRACFSGASEEVRFKGRASTDASDSSKDAYGEAEFRRKATSICGGHLVEMRTSNNTESLELPQQAGRLLLLRWWLGMLNHDQTTMLEF